MNRILNIFSLVFILPFASKSFATTGYFMHGYGVKTQGNAGTALANFNDSLTIAQNPAGLSWVGTRVDVGATLFAPNRKSEIQGNLAGADGEYNGNGRNYFVLPEFSANKKINDQVDLGIAIYGNGGMNTGYKTNPYAAFGNRGSAGVDLTQVFISPAVAWRYAENQSIGVAANFLYQRFEAKGVSGFAAFSADPQHLSNEGKDSSTGIGARIGWAAKVTDRLTLGASYSSKIDADRFDRYRGLFAQAGDFDVPENYGVGLSYQLTPKLTVLADVQRINYSDVDSVGNRFDLRSILAGNAFGTEHGQGFGWDDINVYKVGINYAIQPHLTVRAGYVHNDQPIPTDQTFLNILAPGVIKDHVSVGATWNIDPHQEVSVAYTYGLKEQVKGNQSIPAAFGGGEANLEMDQHLFGLSYGYKF